MRIIENRYNQAVHKEPTDFIDTCEHCYSKFEYDENDISYGEFGCAIVTCPCCGKITYLSDIEGIHLSSSNILFPQHFHITEASENFNEEEAQEKVKRGLEWLNKYPEMDFWIYECGTLLVLIKKYEDEKIYQIIVANGYYETTIDCA